MKRAHAIALAITPFITMWPFFYIVKQVIPSSEGRWWEVPYVIAIATVSIAHVASLMTSIVWFMNESFKAK